MNLCTLRLGIGTANLRRSLILDFWGSCGVRLRLRLAGTLLQLEFNGVGRFWLLSGGFDV